jgi:hypothetical protein
MRRAGEDLMNHAAIHHQKDDIAVVVFALS